jgi:hypothetical protein
MSQPTAMDWDSQMVLTITGIPSEYNGKVGGVTLNAAGRDAAISHPRAISGGTIENFLVTRQNYRPFNTGGTYRVVFVVFENMEFETRLYGGVISNIDITQKHTTIAFSQFEKVEL